MNNSNPEKLWSRDFIILVIATTGISCCNYFFLSTLPIYAQNLTGNASYAGLMTGVYTIAAMIIRPFSGMLSDKIGRTKLLILGALICSITCILYNFANGLIVLVLYRVLHGIGFGIHSTCQGAVTADITPKSRLAEGIGYSGIFSTIALATAPGIAIFIIGNGEVQNFRFLFIIAAFIALASMILDCFISYERKSNQALKSAISENNQKENGNGDLPKTFLGFEYSVFLPGAVILLMYLALSSVTSFILLFAIARNLGNIGFFFTVNALGTFLARLLLGKVADQRGADIIVIPGLTLLAILFFLIPLVHSRVCLFIIALPLGLIQGGVGPVINSMMFKRCSEKRRGTVSAAFFSSIDLGLGIGSIIFGCIAATLGYYFVYWGAMILSIMALIVYLTGISEKKLLNDAKLASIKMGERL